MTDKKECSYTCCNITKMCNSDGNISADLNYLNWSSKSSLKVCSLRKDETEIFRLFDLFILLHVVIVREMKNIQHNVFILKSLLNFQKVKVIDLLKILTLLRRKIGEIAEECEHLKSTFSNEIQRRIQELDELFLSCAVVEFNCSEIDENFNLMPTVIDAFLYDCGLDLTDMDRMFSRLDNEIQEKLHSFQSFDDLKLSSKARRFQRYIKQINIMISEQLKQLLSLESFVQRLFTGNCQHSINDELFKCLPIDISINCCSKIDKRQFRRIILLKLFISDLSNKLHEKLLSVKEIEIFVGNDKGRHKMTLISSVSVMTSTPVSSMAAKRRLNLDKNEEIFSCDLSFSSSDSGYLPTNDLSIKDSSESIFDVIPFSDDEYEKMSDDIRCVTPLTESIDNSKDISIGINDLLSPLDKNGSIRQYCQQINYCKLTTAYNKYFVLSPDRMCNVSGNFYSNSPKPNGTSNGIGHTEKSLTAVSSEFFHQLNLSESQKESILKKVRILKSNEDVDLAFNFSLKTAIRKARQSDDVDLLFLQQLEALFQYVNKVRQHNSNGSNGFVCQQQHNNSAHCCYYGLFQCVDCNTNNNADTKDDESPEQIVDVHRRCDDANNDIGVFQDDVVLQSAFRNILLDDSSSSDLCNDEKRIDEDQMVSQFDCDPIIRVNLTNSSVLSRSTEVSTSSGQLQNDGNCCTGSDSSMFKSISEQLNDVYLEDIDLALRMSELHIRLEFDYEKRQRRSEVIESKRKIFEQFQGLSLNIEEIEKLKSSVDNDSEKNLKENGDVFLEKSDDWHLYVKRFSESIDELGEDFEKQFFMENVAELSLDRVSYSLCNMSLEYTNRIEITLKLAQKLLVVTKEQFNEIVSFLECDSGSVCKKSFSFSSLRQRCSTMDKVLTNLSFSISNKNLPIKFDCYLKEIEELKMQCSELIQYANGLSKKLSTSKLDSNKSKDIDVVNELPDELLITMDLNNLESIISVSTQRLQLTVSALSYYPCYSRLASATGTENNANIPVGHNAPANMSLLNRLHKLRRITAICAVNIVDLHLIQSKLETEENPEQKNFIEEIKDLLIFWRATDYECHRLLRCTSLIQHMMVSTENAYVELVSLYVVMVSVKNSVNFSKQESEIFEYHLNNLQIYKERLFKWLSDIEMCASFIHHKRITNKKFKYYEDIYGFLQESLNTIIELTEIIKDQCHQAVKIVTDILIYHANFAHSSVVEFDRLATNAKLKLDKPPLNDLKEMECKIGDTACTLNDSEKRSEDEMISSVVAILIDRISTIATHAARNSFLLFLEKHNFINKEENDKQIASWTIISQDDEMINEICVNMVDDLVIALMKLLLSNVDENENNPLVLSDFIMKEVCQHLSCKALQFLLDQFLTDYDSLNEEFVLEASDDIKDYLRKELSSLLISQTINHLLSENNSKMTIGICISVCFSKIQQKLCQILLNKSIGNLSKSILSIECNTSLNNNTSVTVQHSIREQKQLQHPRHPPPRKCVSANIESYIERFIPTMLEKERVVTVLESECLRSHKPDRVLSVPNVRSTSDRMSKLIAKFNFSSVGEETKKAFNNHRSTVVMERLLERLCMNAIRLKFTEITDEILNETMNVLDVNFSSSGTSNDYLSEWTIPTKSHVLSKTSSHHLFSKIPHKIITIVSDPELLHFSNCSNRNFLAKMYQSEKLCVGFILPKSRLKISETIKVNLNEDEENDIESENNIRCSSTEATDLSDFVLNNSNNFSNDSDDIGRDSATENEDKRNFFEGTAIVYRKSSSRKHNLSLSMSCSDGGKVGNDGQVLTNLNGCSQATVTKCQIQPKSSTTKMISHHFYFEEEDKSFHVQNNSCQLQQSFTNNNYRILSTKSMLNENYEERLSKLFFRIVLLVLLLFFFIILFDNIFRICQNFTLGRLFRPTLNNRRVPF